MSQPFIGEIRIFAGSFAPAGWMFCDGQLLAIADNDVLFALIGTTYGGDGQTTFALPNLQSRVPVHMGTNPGTSTTYQLGEMAGVEQITLTVQQIPIHTHTPNASNIGQSDSPLNNYWGASTSGKPYANVLGGSTVTLDPAAVLPVGGSQPHNNMIPFLGIHYIISLFGIFPQN